MFKKLSAGVLITMLSSPAFGGILTKEDVTCPIGGQKFEITSTFSCTTMGRLMSLQPITSCDFITRVPQCPENKLPLYKDFTDADIAELKIFMTTPAYKDVTTQSRYYLSYIIDKTLTSGSTDTQFFLLQQGLWYTPETQKDETYLKAYHASLDAALSDESFTDKPFWRGAQAWIAIQDGDYKSAENNIRIMKTENKENNEFLADYIKALSYCLKADGDDELCTQHTFISDHQDRKNKP